MVIRNREFGGVYIDFNHVPPLQPVILPHLLSETRTPPLRMSE